eukprot:189233-Pelagomonas_calceolata.AAC.3
MARHCGAATPSLSCRHSVDHHRFAKSSAGLGDADLATITQGSRVSNWQSSDRQSLELFELFALQVSKVF